MRNKGLPKIWDKSNYSAMCQQKYFGAAFYFFQFLKNFATFLQAPTYYAWGENYCTNLDPAFQRLASSARRDPCYK
jgi:hypothetical protein